MNTLSRTRRIAFALGLVGGLVGAPPPALEAQATPPYDRADTLRGSIGPERAWWDVTFYDLHVDVAPADSTIIGRNGIVYRVLEPGATLQIDLQPPLVVDRVTRRGASLEHRREGNVVWVDVPEAVTGDLDTVTVHYRGRPRVASNPPWDGGFAWSRDDRGEPWIATANQGLGASVWWPNKDTQMDEPDSQRIAITVPDPMVNVSNGRLRSVTGNGDGTTTWEWFVTAPINNYDVAVNAGAYAHFGGIFHGEAGPLTLDFWPLEQNLEKARTQFEQVPVNLACFEHWFGPFPWYGDGYALVETPHLGMEHQSAIAYGNGYGNGYRGRDLSGTGLGMEFDFIIVHETAHEWWGNSVTSADLADMWVHESFGNYAESLHVECLRDREAGARYVRGTRANIRNDRPIIPAYGVNAEGSGDMYYKGGNMLHTIRQIVDDDDRWRAILRGIQSTFRHSVVTGDQVRAYISEHAGIDLDPVFRQYLTTTGVPTLELRAVDGGIQHRWADAVEGFDMPVDVKPGEGACVRLSPTGRWQSADVDVADVAELGVDRDYYVRVRRLPADAGGAEPAPADANCSG
ncbi:MAG: M1 family metallopeptidase [Gemmatimonadota bacterium]